MDHFITTAFNWATLHWPAIVSLVGGGAGLSVLLEVILSKLHVDSKKIAYTLLHVFSIVSAVAAFYLASLPDKDIAPVYASLALLAQTWHRFVISPVYNNHVVPFLQDLAQVRNTKQAKVAESTPVVSLDAPIEAGNEFNQPE